MTEPGWYSSKAVPGFERFWDGEKWTDQYRPLSTLGFDDPQIAEPQSEFTAASANTPWSPVNGVNPPPPTAPSGVAYSNAPYEGQFVQPANDGLGIAGLITAFFVPLVGAILGHVGYSKVRPDGTKSKLSLAAIIVGWSFTAIQALVWILIFGSVFFSSVNSSSTYADDYDYNPIHMELAADRILEQANFLDSSGDWYTSCQLGEYSEYEIGMKLDCESTFYPDSAESSLYFESKVEAIGGESYKPRVRVEVVDQNGETRTFENAVVTSGGHVES